MVWICTIASVLFLAAAIDALLRLRKNHPPRWREQQIVVTLAALVVTVMMGNVIVSAVLDIRPWTFALDTGLVTFALGTICIARTLRV
jgi:hypothetical protein